MTDAGHRDGHLDTERLFEAMGLPTKEMPSIDDIPSATHWPSLPAGTAAKEWEQLRAWVEQLQQRFPHLDRHVIPACWWRHNEHVEALAALRDHERVSFLTSAPATAPVDWMRALRDIAALMRSWTAENPCGATHQHPPPQLRAHDRDGWDDYVAADVEYREQRRSSEHRSTPAG